MVLEKIGRRNDALSVLNGVQVKDVRVLNNLGIVLKRDGNKHQAELCYQNAL